MLTELISFCPYFRGVCFSHHVYCCWLMKMSGYGNITPRTGLGKSMTIFYAIVGMPLFLLYLSNIGDIMAKSFKWIYAKVCLCRICPGVAKRREARTRRKIRALERHLNNEYYNDNVCITTALFCDFLFFAKAISI